MIRIIHTSDVHLGAPLGWLGRRAAEQRDALRKAWTAVVDRTLSERADCLIVAGDLFDSNSPPASVVRFVLKELDRLGTASATEVVILPGSHDFLSLGSVYGSYEREFRRLPHVHVLGLDGRSCVVLRKSGMAVHGNPPRSNRSSERQLARLRPRDDSRWNVAVAHGTVEVVPGAAEDHPIALADLSSMEWSYVALGHWHSWREIEGTTAPAVYPGAPETIAVDQVGSGHAALVVLDETGVTTSRLRLGTRSVVEAEVDVTAAPDAAEVATRVRRAVPPGADTIVRLDLTGLLDLGSGFDEAELVEELSSDYFHVALRQRAFRVASDEACLRDLPERFVIGRFARILSEQLESAKSEEERQELEDALKLGVALLQGKDVIA
ncbi:MAG: DNA repair exonuclease [Candidatus Eisenbacteria bacterium]|nr:DNA repair exonuclease [Candidatus Eisenbacteria bacterium]